MSARTRAWLMVAVVLVATMGASAAWAADDSSVSGAIGSSLGVILNTGAVGACCVLAVMGLVAKDRSVAKLHEARAADQREWNEKVLELVAQQAKAQGEATAALKDVAKFMERLAQGRAP